MSYDPNQQWHQPSSQQQPFAPQQGTPNQPIPAGNHQQSQQSYRWVDGNTQVHHQQSQQSWSWQSQSVTQTPAIVQTPQLPPVANTLLMQNTSHQRIHKQLHQNAMAHHQQVMDMHRNMAAGMSSMATITQPQQQQQQQQQAQVTYQAISSPVPQVQSQQQQAQISYQAFSSPVPQTQPQRQLQIGYQTPTTPIPVQPQLLDNIYQQFQQQQPQSAPLQLALEQSQNYGARPPTASPQRTMPQLPPAHAWPPQVGHLSPRQQRGVFEIDQSPNETVHNRPGGKNYDDRFEALERRRNEDLKAMNREGSEMNKRLVGLEQSRTQDQQKIEAKDQEIRRLKEQIAAEEAQQHRDKADQNRIRELESSQAAVAKEREIRRLKEEVASIERARREDAERNSKQMADLVRSQATSPSSDGAFDMSALQKIIKETQTQQLSVTDIERVIEEQVGKRLAGMASKADIHDAGQQMQGALSKVPPGLSEAQVQQAVNRELNNVMEDVANRVKRQKQRHQQMVAERQNERRYRSPEGRLQTDFVVEELPDEVVKPMPHKNERSQGTRAEQTALPPNQMLNVNAPSRPQATAATINAPTEQCYPALETAPPAVGTQAKRTAQKATQYKAIEAPSTPATVPGGPLDPSGPQGVMSNALLQPSGRNRPGPQARRVAQNAMQQRAIKAPIPSDMVPGGALVRSDPHIVANDALALTSGIREPIENLNAAGLPQASQSDGRRAARPQQLEAGSSQKQLEAPPLVQPSGTMSQDLVRQGTDLTKRPCR